MAHPDTNVDDCTGQQVSDEQQMVGLTRHLFGQRRPSKHDETEQDGKYPRGFQEIPIELEHAVAWIHALLEVGIGVRCRLYSGRLERITLALLFICGCILLITSSKAINVCFDLLWGLVLDLAEIGHAVYRVSMDEVLLWAGLE